MLQPNGDAVSRTPRSLAPPPVSLLHGASLFLDFDGTLVDLVDRPDLVTVPPAVTALIGGLEKRLEGRLALVSGRPADEVRRLTGMTTLAVGGSHGLEIAWDAERRESVAAPEALAEIGEAFDRLARANPGALVERKPFGTALHYRAVPELEKEAMALAAALAETSGLLVQPGKMMIELRAGGRDKGSALAAFMASAPRAGTRPVFIGDDLTDEPAFAAAAALDGAGILVGAMRETAARYRLPDVAATLAWLGEAAA